MWTGIASPDAGLSPKLVPMLAFGTAFVFGWLLHRRSELLSVLKQRWVLHLAVAGVLTGLSLWLVELESGAAAVKLVYAASFTLAAWNWIFGIVGAALRFCSAESSVRRYLADASYWMYLAHLPLVFALQMIVRDWPVHWSIKFPLVVGTAVALLLLSYHYVVRSTYIGEILNGRRYTRGHAARATSATPIAAGTSDAYR
jgi:peptidoglycan/LPS O-acetylase OafA/YrhL